MNYIEETFISGI